MDCKIRKATEEWLSRLVRRVYESGLSTLMVFVCRRNEILVEEFRVLAQAHALFFAADWCDRPFQIFVQFFVFRFFVPSDFHVAELPAVPVSGMNG